MQHLNGHWLLHKSRRVLPAFGNLTSCPWSTLSRLQLLKSAHVSLPSCFARRKSEESLFLVGFRGPSWSNLRCKADGMLQPSCQRHCNPSRHLSAKANLHSRTKGSQLLANLLHAVKSLRGKYCASRCCKTDTRPSLWKRGANNIPFDFVFQSWVSAKASATQICTC